MKNFGIMQGRLSAQVDGKIQAFPWDNWRSEFEIAHSIGLSLMEWTIDSDRIFENPIMTDEGRREIDVLMKLNGVVIPSITCDSFMQKPFFKFEGREKKLLLRQLEQLLCSVAEIGVKIVVIPLVDNSSIVTEREKAAVLSGLGSFEKILRDNNLKVAFESDYSPRSLKNFISCLPEDVFGINYDIGNSASLGFDFEQEYAEYGDRIINVHIKDRKLGGSTVKLGLGDANFSLIFRILKSRGYAGNFILQAARSPSNDHVQVALEYKEFCARFWN